MDEEEGYGCDVDKEPNVDDEVGPTILVLYVPTGLAVLALLVDGKESS